MEITDINNKPKAYLREYKNTKTFIEEEEKDKKKDKEKGKEKNNGRVVTLIKLESRYIAAGSYDSSIRIWDTKKNGKEALIQIKYS